MQSKSPNRIFHLRRVLLSCLLEATMRFTHWRLLRKPQQAPELGEPLPDNPQTPEDYRPLQNACFQDPYAFYQLLRDDYPVYQLPNGIFCISRFEDITALCRDTDTYSSTYQGAIARLKPGQSIVQEGEKHERLAALGIIPSNVLAVQDPPVHTSERKVGHKGLNARFVKTLDARVEALCTSMMDEFIDSGEVEFMQEFGWRLPMQLIIGLLGFPEEDYEKIKNWCVSIVGTQSGISTKVEEIEAQADLIAFIRYCWKQFLIAQKNPRNDLSKVFVDAANDPDNPMTGQVAVSGIFQLIIAGSDSSATSMGNALKMLIENPDIADEIREDIDNKLPAFIEEVFRLESAFQGHFRWTKKDTELHGVKLPRESRIFLMWASGNRDERMFENPEKIDLNRKNGKKHLTFGNGIHACLGRELARAEIRIVLREFLLRTNNLAIAGETPFQASMFARTLVQLPITFEKAEPSKTKPRQQAA